MSGPTLAEDVMLALFREKSGTFLAEGAMPYVLGGSMLTDLALGGWVASEKNKAWALPREAPGDPLLADAYGRVPENPRAVLSLMMTMGTSLRRPVVDRLVERQSLRREARRILPDRLRAADRTWAEALLAAARAVLVDGAEPGPREAALVAMLSASGALPSLHPDIPWSGDVYTRGKALEKGHWGAAATDAMVAATTAAMATVVTSVAGSGGE